MPEYKKLHAKPQAKPKPTFPPKTLSDAIDFLEAEQTFSLVEASQVRGLADQGDKRLKSIFDAYLATQDFDDLADNIFRGIIGIKQRNMRKQRQSELAVKKSSTQSSLLPKKSSVAPPNVQDYGARYQASSSSNSYSNHQPGRINFMGGGEQMSQSQQVDRAQPRKHSSDDNHLDDENLEINDNPNEVRQKPLNSDRAAPTPMRKRSRASWSTNTRFFASTRSQV